MEALLHLSLFLIIFLKHYANIRDSFEALLLLNDSILEGFEKSDNQTRWDTNRRLYSFTLMKMCLLFVQIVFSLSFFPPFQSAIADLQWGMPVN